MYWKTVLKGGGVSGSSSVGHFAVEIKSDCISSEQMLTVYNFLFASSSWSPSSKPVKFYKSNSVKKMRGNSKRQGGSGSYSTIIVRCPFACHVREQNGSCT